MFIFIKKFHFLFNFFLRENKFSNVDCHFTIQCSKEMPDGSFQLPIVVLHLNFPPSLNKTPTLLTFGITIKINLYNLKKKSLFFNFLF